MQARAHDVQWGNATIPARTFGRLLTTALQVDIVFPLPRAGKYHKVQDCIFHDEIAHSHFDWLQSLKVQNLLWTSTFYKNNEINSSAQPCTTFCASRSLSQLILCFRNSIVYFLCPSSSKITIPHNCNLQSFSLYVKSQASSRSVPRSLSFQHCRKHSFPYFQIAQPAILCVLELTQFGRCVSHPSRLRSLTVTVYKASAYRLRATHDHAQPQHCRL